VFSALFRIAGHVNLVHILRGFQIKLEFEKAIYFLAGLCESVLCGIRIDMKRLMSSYGELRAPWMGPNSPSLAVRLYANVVASLPPKNSNADQFRAQLRLINWQWRIVGLDLPEDLKEHLAKELVKLTNELLPDTNL
jgi:hypothetical protein